VLTAYTSQLENRVVARFDAAASDGDEAGQAECVRIMIQCGKERAIAQVGRFPVLMGDPWGLGDRIELRWPALEKRCSAGRGRAHTEARRGGA
jgi:hypothetical protein